MRSDPFAPYNVLRLDETELSLEVSKGYKFLFAVTYSLVPFMLLGAAVVWIVMIRQEDELQFLWIGVILSMIAAILLMLQKTPIRITVTSFGIDILRYQFLHRTSAMSVPRSDIAELHYRIESGKSRRGVVRARLHDGRWQILMIVPPLELDEKKLELAAAEIGRRLGLSPQRG